MMQNRGLRAEGVAPCGGPLRPCELVDEKFAPGPLLQRKHWRRSFQNFLARKISSSFEKSERLCRQCRSPVTRKAEATPDTVDAPDA